MGLTSQEVVGPARHGCVSKFCLTGMNFQHSMATTGKRRRSEDELGRLLDDSLAQQSKRVAGRPTTFAIDDVRATAEHGAGLAPVITVGPNELHHLFSDAELLALGAQAPSLHSFAAAQNAPPRNFAPPQQP